MRGKLYAAAKKPVRTVIGDPSIAPPFTAKQGQYLAVIYKYPHYLSFFNVLVGGPSHGPEYLSDSNIDWGQDVKYLRAYADSHGIRNLCLSYYGLADLGYYGIACRPIPKYSSLAALGKMDCTVAVSSPTCITPTGRSNACGRLNRKPALETAYTFTTSRPIGPGCAALTTRIARPSPAPTSRQAPGDLRDVARLRARLRLDYFPAPCHTIATMRIILAFLVAAGAWAQQPPHEPAVVGRLRAALDGISHTINDFGDTRRYAPDNETVPPPAPGEERVVFLGDSITDFWGRRGSPFFPGKPYINRGISGQVTPQMLVRFYPDVVALRPKAVVILAGTNDIGGNIGPLPIEASENSLMSMADLARANNIKVILSSLLPVSDYHPRPNQPPSRRSRLCAARAPRS